jgi:hypothetical protein
MAILLRHCGSVPHIRDIRLPEVRTTVSPTPSAAWAIPVTPTAFLSPWTDLGSLLHRQSDRVSQAGRQSGRRRFGKVFPLFGLAQPGPARFGVQYRLLPADRAKRAVVPDVLRRRRPLQCFHDCLTPLRRHRCGNSALLFGRDFVPAARVSQQQLLRARPFARGNVLEQTALLSLCSVVRVGRRNDEPVYPDIPATTGKNESGVQLT